MPLCRRRFFSLAVLGWGGVRVWTEAQEAAPARLGILLDTSAEMGFLVPQARKELRILNEHLASAGRSPVVMREIVGSDLDREASTSVGARRNVLYAMKALYEECDTVLWITCLKGQQSPQGIFALETLLKEKARGASGASTRPSSPLAGQILAGSEWVLRPPGRRAIRSIRATAPGNGFVSSGRGRGMIQRSWQTPPPDFRAQFAFPYRVADFYYLKKLGLEAREANFEQGWSRDLASRHGLWFVREKEEWLPRITGRRWLEEATLLPFPDGKGLKERSAKVLEGLCARDPIERDLARIVAEKIGVVFAFGYVSQDWKRQQSMRETTAAELA